MAGSIKAEDLGSALDPEGEYLIEVGGRRKPSADGATVAATLADWARSATLGTKAAVIDTDGRVVGTVTATGPTDPEPAAEGKVIGSEAKVVNPPDRSSRSTRVTKDEPTKKATTRKRSTSKRSS